MSNGIQISDYELNRLVRPTVGVIEDWPANAAPSTATTSTTTWLPGSWVSPLAASTITVPFYVLGIIVVIQDTSEIEWQFDVAYGASNTVIGSFHSLINQLGGTQRSHNAPWMTFPAPVLVPANSAVSVRAASGAAAASNADVKVITARASYFSDGMDYRTVLGATKQVSVKKPDLANGAGPLTGSPAWTKGTWVVVFDNTVLTQPHALVGIEAGYYSGGTPTAATRWFEIDVGLGAAGSEVVKATVPYVHELQGTVTLISDMMHFTLPIPVRVPASTALSIRTSGSVTGTGISVAVVLTPLPFR